jgi:hypothetical protein
MHRDLKPNRGAESTQATPETAVFIRYGRRRFQADSLRAVSSQELEIAVSALTMPPGTPVEVEFLHSGRHWRLPAQVARGNGHGLGLRLKVPQPDLLSPDAVDPDPINLELRNPELRNPELMNPDRLSLESRSHGEQIRDRATPLAINCGDGLREGG